uniref:Protein kinase domain-containing protein n=1 Tax=Meloidogyne hapla TaxID=6305 RepID=A0A1I8AZH3_MELHA
MINSKYSFLSKLGQGAHGSVLKARNLETNKIFAIKQITLVEDTNVQLRIFREIQSLRLFNHKNDLKPENILIKANNQIKIADFGLACIYFPNDPNRDYEHQVATRWYRAPELLFGATKYTPKVDIWALGCIFAEFFNGIPLFMGGTDIEQLSKVFHILGTPTEESWPGWEILPDAGKVLFDITKPFEDWKKLIPLANNEFIQFIQLLLQLDHKRRPSAIQCLQNNYLSNYQHFANIKYKPPLLENFLKKKIPEINYKIIKEENKI